MMTPQEISEKTFVKAVFGGYDMESVDEFLDPLTEDYIALYKENSVLKSKMKVLVETVEEYRTLEETVNKTLFTAQKTADDLIKETERKCAQMMNNAEAVARSKVESLRDEIATEEENLNRARRAAHSYFEKLKDLSRQQISLVEDIQSQEIHRIRKQDAAQMQTTRPIDISKAIESTMEKLMDDDSELDDADMEKTRPVPNILRDDSATRAARFESVEDADEYDEDEGDEGPKFEFADLQFGKEYDPVQK